MKLFKPTAILLVILLAAMVMVPMVSAAPDTISPEKIKLDKKFISVEKATSVANIYVKQFSSSFTDYSDWKGATVRKATTYFDLNGKESAYSFDVLVNGQYVGYLIVSATRDNYPVLEFSKGKTPDREISVQNNAKTLAATDAKTRQATIGEGRPIYLGATFYYMQYPVQKAGILKGSQQISDDTIVVDLHENKVVDLKTGTSPNTQMITTGAQANTGLDEKSIENNQVLKSQDAEAEWNAFDNRMIAKTEISSVKSAQRAVISEKIIKGGTYFNDNNEVGCAPESAGMVLGYYRDIHNFGKFSAHNVLPFELAAAMHTTPVWYDIFGFQHGGTTWMTDIKPGIDQVTSANQYQFITVNNWVYNYYTATSEIDQDQPYMLGMVCSYYGFNHVVAAIGYRQMSDNVGPVLNYVVVNDAQGRPEVNIRSGNWLYAYSIYVHPPPSLPAVVPLCQAGNAFDATMYPQNWPQSDPMTVSCNWDGNGRVYLSGSSSELIGTYADDGFTVDTPNGIQFDAEGHYAHQHAPLELTSGMNTGSNTLTLIVRNYRGLSMSYGSSTGIGTDQTPYIIEVNDQSMIAAAQSSAAKAFTFVPNSTPLNESISTTTTQKIR
jgi:hypothetical protein